MRIYPIGGLIVACGLFACSCQQDAPAEAPERKGVTVGDQGTMNAAQAAFEKRQAELAKKKAEKNDKPAEDTPKKEEPKK